MVWYFLLSGLIVLADQLVKLWVMGNIPLHGFLPFLPQVLGLTYVRNTGASFSLLADHTWLLVILSAVSSVVVAVLLVKRFLPRPMGMLGLALVLGGAVGNLIDRVRLGYVVDMFQTLFIDFAIFNVADVGIVIGGVLVMLYLLTQYGKDQKEAT